MKDSGKPIKALHDRLLQEQFEAVQDDFLDRQAMCVSVKMGFTSVYSAHSPIEGKVVEQWLDVPRKFSLANKMPIIWF